MYVSVSNIHVQASTDRDPGIKTCPSQRSPGHLVPLSEERQTRVPIKLTTVRIYSVKVQNASRPKRLDLNSGSGMLFLWSQFSVNNFMNVQTLPSQRLFKNKIVT